MMTASGYYSGNACRQAGTELTDYACLSNLSIEGVSENAFISRIMGRGMDEAGIADGDWLVFDSCPDPVNGDIVSLTVYGQGLCRRVFLNRQQTKKFRAGSGSAGKTMSHRTLLLTQKMLRSGECW